MTPISRTAMEQRRCKAARLLQNGFPPNKLSRRFGVSRTSASRWVRKFRIEGPTGMLRRRTPGRPPRLTNEQRSRLAEVYHRGPQFFGFEAWTHHAFAAAIEFHFGIKYHPDHAGRILHALGLAPKRRYLSRKPTEVQNS